jgi:DNA-binding PadR family transcriptional regulator
MVPKGFLRYHVLEALDKEPMSGSELMDQIYKHTGSTWKPSPGSIYPLLAWLQDNAYIKEIPTENGLKRYDLTQSGKDLLEEQTKIREKFTENSGFLTSPFMDRFFGDIPLEKTKQIRLSMRKLVISSIKLAKAMKKEYSEKELDEALRILDEASEKLEGLNNRIMGERNIE